jgi:hypothetical protein
VIVRVQININTLANVVRPRTMQARWISLIALVGWIGCSPIQGGINHGIGGNGGSAGSGGGGSPDLSVDVFIDAASSATYLFRGAPICALVL